MLTKEKFDQGLEENCNLEQGDADFPEEIDFPLCDLLDKTPIWSLSTTLKEELAKYKLNVIQPALTPWWILKFKRGPSYDENIERVEKNFEEDIKNSQEYCQPGQNKSEKPMQKTSNKVDVALIDKLISKITPSKDNLMYIAISNLELANRRCEESFRSLLLQETSKLLDVAEQQKLGEKTTAEISNAILALAPAGEVRYFPDLVCFSHYTTNYTYSACVPRQELCPQNKPSSLRQAQSYRDKIRMFYDLDNIH